MRKMKGEIHKACECVCMRMCQTSLGYALVFINGDWKLSWEEKLKIKNVLSYLSNLHFALKV